MTCVDLHPEDQRLIQASALSYLQHYQPKHAGNDQILFSKTVQHMITAYGLKTPTAQKMVSCAYGELKTLHERRRVDISASTEHLVVITDPANGMTWAVPVTAIVQRVIEAPDNCRLRLV